MPHSLRPMRGVLVAVAIVYVAGDRPSAAEKDLNSLFVARFARRSVGGGRG
jgi:hypothetical protein